MFEMEVKMLESSCLGRGLYTIPQAAHLTQIKSNSIRSWIEVDGDGTQYGSESSVFATDYPLIVRSISLSFLDMLEIRFIYQFRRLVFH
jgi:hypothetical protein